MTKPTVIWGDNDSATISLTEPGSALKNKMVALSCHTVREHCKARIVDIRYIGTDDNHADPVTKAAPSGKFHGHFGEHMRN